VACPAEDVLDGFASGRLDEAAAGIVELHLDGCDECMRVVSALAATEEYRAESGPPESIAAAIGRYRVLEILGEGGMGRVYRAYDPQLDRPVALKVLRRKLLADDVARARMVREARAMARIVHPNIVTVFDAGEVDGTTFIAMELVVGTTLARWLAAERPVSEVVAAFVSAGSALAAAHDRGVVHRDFKPANVLVDEGGRVAVTDFGLASSEGAVAPSSDVAPDTVRGDGSSTKTGTILGTPQFMSPEQYRHARVDARSDQFSFAVALFGALYRSPPFPQRTLEEARSSDTWQLCRIEPPLQKTVPPRIHAALVRALSIDPNERFPDMRALIAELTAGARGLGGVPKETRGRRRGPLLSALGLVAAIVAVATMGGFVRKRSAAGASPPAESAPTAAVVTLLDLPTPSSTSNEALAAYREGLAAQHDGVRGSYKLYHGAASKDPALVAADLRHALIELSTDDPDRQEAALQAYRRAVAGRDRLVPRDRAVADALGPALLGQPADWASCEQRLRDLAAKAPLDEPLLVNLGQVLSVEGKLAEADEAFDHAILLDPKDVGARALRADRQLVRGDLAGAGATAASCVEMSPGSTRCISLLFSARSIEGKCHETEALAQRLITVSPEDLWGYLDLHESELALAEPDETVLATEERLIRATDAADKPWATLHYPWLRAVLEGDFARANELIDEEEALAVKNGSLSDQLRALYDTAAVAMETGDLARAGRAADMYLKRRQALPPPTYVTRNAVARDHVPPLLVALRRAGLLAADDARRKRDEWLGTWQARFNGREASYLWIQGYALPAETRADADEALAHAPSDLGPVLTGDELEVEAVGRVYVLAGRYEEATPLLDSASKQCRVRRFPLGIPRAGYYLGLAREGVGDKAGACEAYARVLGRWGKPGKVRSVTAGLAAQRSRALGCGT
jgi:serine/threonine protein kinase/tetratricopeptide (TPR) repeat protein